MKRIGFTVLILLLTVTFVFAAGRTQGSSGGGAVSTGPASISVEVFDFGTDGGRTNPTDNNWTKWIQEKVLKEENINVSFVAVPRSQEVSMLNVMMAAGDAPDISYTYTNSVVYSFGGQGGLFDMLPYVDSHMPDLKSWLGEDEALPGKLLINRMVTDGKLYAVPARRMTLGRTGVFIRKDWLDKLGLPLPTTRDQYYNAMVAFKEKDPGNVGKDRVIPLSDGGGITLERIYNSFRDPNLSDKNRWIEGDVMQPAYKEAVRFLNKMYNEGLIDRDFPIYNDSTTSSNLIKSGRVGSYMAGPEYPYRDTPGDFKELLKNVPDAIIEPIDPFADSRGRTPKDIYDPAGILNFIPIFSKAPEAAMRYLNWLSRFENRNFLQIGPEGIVHDIVDGIPKIKAAPGPWIQNFNQNLDYTPVINGLDLGDPVKNAKALVNSYNPAFSALIERGFALSVKDGTPFPVIPVVIESAATYNSVLSDKLANLRVRAISCTPAQFDKVFDDALKDYLASGYQEVINERRAKYPAQ